ncbi:MAG: RHS repeat protein, partial [Halanaerobiales bacterium]|nr:RHS repeat protein [Halanaerobiales bacterium]
YVYHGGQENVSYTNTYDYDEWGNVIYQYNSESDVEVYYGYLNTEMTKIAEVDLLAFDETQEKVDEHIHNLLKDQYVLNRNPITDEFIPQQIHYQYDEKGNVIVKAVRHNLEWIKTRYTYDLYGYGNVRFITDALSNVTESVYDSKYNAYLVKVKQNAGKDADGVEQGEIIIQYGYDELMGTKLWEIDPNGALTEYGYDNLGRLIWVTYPDETDEYPEIIDNLSPDQYQNREDNPVKLQIYDDTMEDTNDSINVAKVANVVLNREIDETVYANIVTDIDTIVDIIPENYDFQIVNLARYEYDELNRMVEIKQYLKESELQEFDGEKQSSPFVTHFDYDQVGNRIKEIDAEGYVTFKEYDGLNRLTDIYYPDGEKYKATWNEATNYHLNIEYDSISNKRIVTDPEGRITEEIKDWNGRVREVTKYNDGEKYTSYAAYDRFGNQVRIIDGKGQKYDFIYNDLNQTVKEIMHETEVILPDGSLQYSYRPEVSYEYDKLGRKIVEIKPNGNATSKMGDYRLDYDYDGSGRLVKTVVNKFDQNLVTKNYYNSTGNVIKSVDPEGRTVQQFYHPRGLVLAEVDPIGRIVYHQYNELGKEIAVTDPRGVVEESEADFEGINVEILGTTYRINSDYTTKVEYDSLARQVKATDLMGNTIEIQYNRVGAKLFV